MDTVGLMGAVVCAIALTACETAPTYGPIGGEKNATYGYKERTSADGRIIILVVVPASSNSSTAYEFWDRRAHEICKSSDYTRNIFRAERATLLYQYYGGRPGDYALEGYVACNAPQQRAAD